MTGNGKNTTYKNGDDLLLFYPYNRFDLSTKIMDPLMDSEVLHDVYMVNWFGIFDY